MKKHDTYRSGFIKADQLDDGGGRYRTMIVTIKAIRSHTFEDGNNQRVLVFEETDSELGLNVTNWDSVAEITREGDDDNWIGHRIELYVDRNVTYGGKRVPAIRIRPPQVDPVPQEQIRSAPAPAARTSAPPSRSASPSRSAPPPRSSAPSQPPPPPPAKPFDRDAAWDAIAADERARGKEPDVDVWNFAISEVEKTTGKAEADFGPDEWKKVHGSYPPF